MNDSGRVNGMLHSASMLRMPRRIARLRRRARDWGNHHPGVMGFLERIGCLRLGRGVVARGVAVGLFVGLTPTVGFQTLLMLGFCALLRGNFLAAFAVSWISNPLTLTPLYLGYYLLGKQVFEPLLGPLTLFTNNEVVGSLLEVICFGLGSLLVALPVAATGYVSSYWLVHAIAQRRRPA